MKRYLEGRIVTDLKKKMVLLAGSGQVGKTFLSKQLTGITSIKLSFEFEQDKNGSLVRNLPVCASEIGICLLPE